MPGAELPAPVLETAERLTRRARAAEDAAAATARERRDDLLDEHGYTARERADDAGATLVCYPSSWLDETGTLRRARYDPSAAIERSLSGPGDPERWAAVAERNREIARRVREAHGDVHGATTAALADFASNHYAKPLTDLTRAELREFREEYFERNAWPSDAQRDRLGRSLRYAFGIVDRKPP